MVERHIQIFGPSQGWAPKSWPRPSRSSSIDMRKGRGGVRAALAIVLSLGLAISAPALAEADGKKVVGYLYTTSNGEGINEVVRLARYEDGSLGTKRPIQHGSAAAPTTPRQPRATTTPRGRPKSSATSSSQPIPALIRYRCCASTDRPAY